MSSMASESGSSRNLPHDNQAQQANSPDQDEPTEREIAEMFAMGDGAWNGGAATDGPGGQASAQAAQPQVFQLPQIKAWQPGPANEAGNSDAAFQPELYILSSPTGPQALLINGSVGTYSTPAIPRTMQMPFPPNVASALPPQPSWVQAPEVLAQQHHQHQQHVGQQQGQQQFLEQQHQQFVQQQQQRQNQILQQHLQQHMQLVQQHQIRQQQQQQQPAVHQNQQELEHFQQQFHQHFQQQLQGFQQPGGPQAPNGPFANHQHGAPDLQQAQNPPAAADNIPHPPHAHDRGLRPNNPGAGMLAALWPHAWLILRLSLFVWWFTSPTATWTRWCMVILLALAVFVFNTGVIDELGNQIWAPIRQHLDGLLPGADVQRRQNAAAAEAQAQTNNENAADGDLVDAGEQRHGAADATGTVGQDSGAEPDPAEVAARLVAQRRHANRARAMDLIRRFERVGLMLLASLAPGIAERHVAMVEEEARAVRQRQREAAEAAEAEAIAARAREEEEEKRRVEEQQEQQEKKNAGEDDGKGEGMGETRPAVGASSPEQAQEQTHNLEPNGETQAARREQTATRIEDEEDLIAL